MRPLSILEADSREPLDALSLGSPETIAKRPIKVCFISPLGFGLYRPERMIPFGGAEVQFFLVSRQLSKDPGFQVSVVTTVTGSPGVERQGSVTLISRQGRGRLSCPQGGSWYRIGGRLVGYGVALFEMLALFREIDADVYLHAGAGEEVGAYALLCRCLRRRFVFVVASSADLSDSTGLLRGPLRRLFPLGLRLAHAVVCRTEEQMSLLRDRWGREGVLIRTGHPLEPLQTTESGNPRATGLSEIILWVGRMHPLKQPQMFLDLAARLPGERCVMVVMRDDAHQPLREEILSRASSLQNLTVCENVPLAEIDGFFTRAKILVNTSTYEGFPNTFVQAARSGVPILSWIVDPDGILGRHRIGVCAGGSFDRLIVEAEALCDMEALRKDLGSRGRQYARTHHDLDRCVEEWKTLVRTLLPDIFSSKVKGGSSDGPIG